MKRLKFGSLPYLIKVVRCYPKILGCHSSCIEGSYGYRCDRYLERLLYRRIFETCRLGHAERLNRAVFNGVTYEKHKT